jgi:hypothetical protein
METRRFAFPPRTSKPTSKRKRFGFFDRQRCHSLLASARRCSIGLGMRSPKPPPSFVRSNEGLAKGLDQGRICQWDVVSGSGTGTSDQAAFGIALNRSGLIGGSNS